MQSTGFIPLMPAMVHPNAPLYSFKTSKNLPFCSSFRDDEMITSRVLSSPKNTYSKVLGNRLSSSFGGDSDDEMSFVVGNYPLVVGRIPKFLMHFLTLALLHLLPLAILEHSAIIPPKSIGIGAISRIHDVDTSRVAR